MKIRTREPLNPELEALLEFERRPIAQSEAMRARAFSRMQGAALAAPLLVPKRRRIEMARLVWPAAAVLGFGAAAAAAVRIDRYFSAPVPTQAASATTVSSALVPVSGVDSIVQRSPAPQLTASSAPGLVIALAPSASSAPQARSVATTTPVVKAAPSAQLAQSAQSAQSASPVLGSESYPQELALLQPARAGIARGDFAAALSAVSEHSRRFPSGLLGEERDALRVRALFGLHRVDEARRAAAAFRGRYPRSVLLSTIAQKVETTP